MQTWAYILCDYDLITPMAVHHMSLNRTSSSACSVSDQEDFYKYVNVYFLLSLQRLSCKDYLRFSIGTFDLVRVRRSRKCRVNIFIFVCRVRFYKY